MRKLIAFVTGIVFGLGLLVSDMVNPAVVRGFLNLFGDWNPTLVFVMGGAVVISFFAWRVAARARAPVLGGSFPAWPAGGIDGRLVGGSALFGVGWGLVGVCPGPALVTLMSGRVEPWIFVLAMLVGMLAWERVAGAGQGIAAGR